LPEKSSVFRAQVRKDVAAALESDGVFALYRPLGSSVAGQLVTVRVSGVAERPLRPSALQAITPGSGHGFRASMYEVEVAAFAADEVESVVGSGVGAAGGVKIVRSGDTFIVPGSEVHRPDMDEVMVVVGTEIDLIESSLWRVGVTL